MARFKPAGTHKSKPPRGNRALIPCAILILMMFAALFLIFYDSLKVGK